MCSCIAAKGWRSVVLNYRGCAGLELTSPTLYCASFTDDVHLAVEEIHHQFPNARLFAAGYSLGSLILCKYLAEAANGTWKVKGMTGTHACHYTKDPLVSKVPLMSTWLRIYFPAVCALAFPGHEQHVMCLLLGNREIADSCQAHMW
jgi:predicted alpha/beta-fold hydrolase